MIQKSRRMIDMTQKSRRMINMTQKSRRMIDMTQKSRRMIDMTQKSRRMKFKRMYRVKTCFSKLFVSSFFILEQNLKSLSS